jgi:integrase
MAKHEKKRPNGTGTVYQRKSDKKWIAAITLESINPKTGKPNIKVKYATSKREAQSLLKGLLRDRAIGDIAEGGGISLSDYLWQWLNEKKALEVRPQSLASIRTSLRHVILHIGNLRLDKVTPTHVRRCYATLLETLSPRTVANIHIYLAAAFAAAVDERYIVRDPMHAVPKPKWEQVEWTRLDAGQLGQLLTQLETDRLYPFFALLVFTGLREGEAFALTWNDIDWERSILRVERGLVRVPGGGYRFGPLKTKGSRRRVKLVPTLLDALKDHAERQRFEKRTCEKDGQAWKEPELVFTGVTGRPLESSGVGNRLRTATDKLGFPHVRIHDLRHSFATIASEGKVQPQNLQRLLGHSDLGTTYSIYAAALETMQDDAVSSVEMAITGKKERR